MKSQDPGSGSDTLRVNQKEIQDPAKGKKSEANILKNMLFITGIKYHFRI